MKDQGRLLNRGELDSALTANKIRFKSKWETLESGPLGSSPPRSGPLVKRLVVPT